MYTFFKNIFNGINVPVVVCGVGEYNPVVYESPAARGLLLGSCCNGSFDRGGMPLREALLFEQQGGFDAFLAALKTGGLSEYIAVIIGGDGQRIPVSITANRADRGGSCYVIYIYPPRSLAEDKGGLLATAFHLACNADDPEEAIRGVLALMSGNANVSRSYIFEPVSETAFSNTYEWCAAGVKSVKDTLQCLDRTRYYYNKTVERGIYVAENVDMLPSSERELLEPQGVKSLVIIPITQHGITLGYAGFDDCRTHRKWGVQEIKLLEEMTAILAILMARRNAGRTQERTLGVLQTISDNSENGVYVNDINTYEVLFINTVLARNLGVTPEEAVGQKCWKVLQKGMDGPCDFCPMKKMIGPDSAVVQEDVTWEFRNTVDGRWYLLQDSIIRWHDGRKVHMETATEITRIKAYEEQLEHIASTDMMTGVYTREWGYGIMEGMLNGPPQKNTSLVFLDIDGLKHVNDTLGHENGDRMIITVVDIIKSKIRKSDVICRWGGDEFIMLLRCREEIAHKIMAGIQAEISARNRKGDLPFHLSLSYGITCLDSSLGDIGTIISRADKLMYEDKQKKCKQL